MQNNNKKLSYFIFGALAITLAYIGGCCTTGASSVASSTASAYIDNEQNLNHLYGSTIIIFNEVKKVECTGVFISPTEVMSARHCFVLDESDGVDPNLGLDFQEVLLKELTYEFFLYDAYVNDKKFEEKNVGNLKLVYLPKDDTDLVILKLTGDHIKKSKNWVPVAKREPRLSERVYGVYMPGKLPWILTDGRVAQRAYDRKLGPPFKIVKNYINISVNKGASGGPVVNNRGELVGILSMMDPTGNIGIFLSTTLINETVTKYIKSIDPRKTKKEKQVKQQQLPKDKSQTRYMPSNP